MNDYGFYSTADGVETPHFDRFKRTAMTFEKACCASPACVPSRAAALSGLHPHRTCADCNGCDLWTQATRDSIEPLPEPSRRSGYTTYGQGKILYAPVAERNSVRCETTSPEAAASALFRPSRIRPPADSGAGRRGSGRTLTFPMSSMATQ